MYKISCRCGHSQVPSKAAGIRVDTGTPEQTHFVCKLIVLGKLQVRIPQDHNYENSRDKMESLCTVSMPASLPILEGSQPHTFLVPTKRINEGHDVPFFLTSRAYSDIGVFMMQLNTAMCPRKSSESSDIQTWQLDEPLQLSEPVERIQALLGKIASIIEEAPPDTGPRRFGNVSFRKWYEILESRVRDLLSEHLPDRVLNVRVDTTSNVSVLDELTPYLLGGFGSSQRLDYGTGHELSFLAFIACIWKLGGFAATASSDGSVERSIVLGIIEP
jgi:serine/threonine-protein phosphatase 2A activator